MLRIINPIPRRQRLPMIAVLMLGAGLLVYFRPSAQSATQTITLRSPAKTRIGSVAFSPDGQSVLLSVEPFGLPMRGATAQVHDARSGQLLRTLLSVNNASPIYARLIQSAAFSRNGDEIACETYPLTVRDAQNGRIKHTLVGKGAGHTGIFASPDGRFWASGESNAVQLWSAVTGQRAKTLGTAPTTNAYSLPFVNCAAFSPDSRLLVSGHTDGAVRLWNVTNGTLQQTLSPAGVIGARGAGVSAVAFSPDNRTVAVTDARMIWLFDAQTAHLLRSWSAPEEVSIFGLSFSPDGRTLAGGGPNFTWRQTPERGFHGELKGPIVRNTVGEIELWDASSGDLRRTLRAGYWVIDLVFSPDGKTLASSGDDNTALLWKVPA